MTFQLQICVQGAVRLLITIAVILLQGATVTEVLASAEKGTLTIIGEVVPRQGGEVAAAISAPVQSVGVVAGDRVQQGDNLAQLNIDDRRADLETARAQIAVAQAERQVREAALELEAANLDRLASLQGSAAFNAGRLEDSQKAMARLRAEITVARARIEEARARAARLLIDIDRARITAPYPGVVTSREVDVGDFVTPGRRMFTLINTNDLEVEADVPTGALSRIRAGDVLEAETREGKPVSVRVRVLIPVENPLTRTRTVRFVVEGTPALAIGQPLEVHLPDVTGG